MAEPQKGPEKVGLTLTRNHNRIHISENAI